MIKAIINVKIYDYDNFIDNGYVIFDKEIIEVGEMKNFTDNNYQIINGVGKLLLPNFVCAHSHIYSIFARGLSLPFAPHNFLEILEQMWWKIDAKIDNNVTYYSALASGKEFLLNGVTTVIDHHASGEDIRGSLTSLKKGLVDILNLRAILCFETSDRYPLKDCLLENRNFALRYHNDHIAGLFGLHASMTLSNKSLSLVKRYQHDIPLHVHVAESVMDEEDSLTKYNTDIISRFNKYNLLKPDSLIVHGVHIKDEELDIIKNKGAYMVVNTTSNMNNAVGIPNVKKYLEKRIPVLVGNDGLSTNMATEYLNVFYTSHLKNESATCLNLNDIRKMINDTYDYVNKRLNIKIGKIKKGYLSDFLLIDYVPFTKMDSMNAFGHLFYGLFPSFKPSHVYVDGKLLVKNYQLTSKKALNRIKKCNEYSSLLWDKVKE